MKKLLIIACFGLLTFALSAAASWMLQQNRMEKMRAEAASTDDGESTESDAESQSEESTSHTSSTDSTAPKSADANMARIPTPVSYTAAVDDTVQVASSLRERMNAVRERENQLSQRQVQVDMILKDIRDQRVAIDELRQQITEEFKAAEEQLAAGERQRAEIEAQEQSLKDRLTELELVERDGTKRLATVYDGMASDRAAKILEHMVNTGKMDTAVKLLGVMRERQAAKILGEFEDTSLAAQLSDRLKGLKKPAPTVKN